jgi:2-methylcitrate dehydratase PrpD
MNSFQSCKQALKKFVSYQRQKEEVEDIKRKIIDQVAVQTNIVNDKEKNEANTDQKLSELEII